MVFARGFADHIQDICATGVVLVTQKPKNCKDNLLSTLLPVAWLRRKVCSVHNGFGLALVASQLNFDHFLMAVGPIPNSPR